MSEEVLTLLSRICTWQSGTMISPWTPRRMLIYQFAWLWRLWHFMPGRSQTCFALHPTSISCADGMSEVF